MTQHHPKLDNLVEYSSSTLSLSHSLCISAHIEYCSECQNKVRKLNAVGGELLDSIEDVKNYSSDTEHLKNKVFELIDKNVEDLTQEKTEKTTNEFKSEYDIPQCIKQFVDQSYDQLKWFSLSPSFKIATLCKDLDGSEVALTRVKAGGKMAHHTHAGKELTMVLEGSFSDESGIYRRGDFIERSSDDSHKPVVSKDSECICLTVLDAPIQFTGRFTKLLNPFLKKRHSS